MQPGNFVAILLLSLVLPGLAAAQEEHLLEVMLQGESAQEMATLVTAQGGEITHNLPIIHAVGARLSRKQLDAILASNKVERYIDDLALDDQPTPTPHEHENDCAVSGAVVLEQQKEGFSWQIFNKMPDPARLERIGMSWPQALGRLEHLSLDGIDIPLGDEVSGTAADISIAATENISLVGKKPLQARFEHYPAHHAPLQRDFDITLTFAGGCETKLIPGYPDNETDYYFSEVTGADQLQEQGVLGDGITIAVLDSGLWEHPALTKDTRGRTRVPARYDAISGKRVDVAFDESGHGTHLVSTIAHSGRTLVGGAPSGGYRGIAPDVTIIPVKAFNREGQGSMLDIVRGVQWVLDNRARYNIRVLNLSFAARPRWPYYLDPIDQAVMQAWAAGIVVVAAAGNEGPEPMTIGSPGNTPYVITVGTVTDSWTPEDRSDDYVPDFSSRGPTPEAFIKPDLVAPGGHITGLIRPGSGLTLEHPDYALEDDVIVLTGTSQSTAVVSGLIALLLQLEPDLKPDEVKCKLLDTADPAINKDGLLAYSPFVQGHGYVNLARAIVLGERGCGNAGLDVQHDIDDEEHFEGPAIVDDERNITLPGLEKMLSPDTPAKGSSTNRAWGVKAHIERLPTDYKFPSNTPFDWMTLYQQEKLKIEKLSGGK